jgi:hypothetical protein
MSDRVRTLTSSEIQKLPRCRWSWDSHAKCFDQVKEPVETLLCIKCCMEGLLYVLVHPDGQPDAIHALDGLAAMLKEIKVLE